MHALKQKPSKSKQKQLASNQQWTPRARSLRHWATTETARVAPAKGSQRDLGPRVHSTPHLKPNLHAGKGGWDFQPSISPAPTENMRGNVEGKKVGPSQKTVKQLTQ